MKVNVESPSNLHRRLHIEVPADEVSKSFEDFFLEIQRTTEIKGFRKGKAPLQKVRSLFKDRVKQDVVGSLVQKYYFLAIRQNNLKPLSNPEFEYDDLEESRPFTFSASLDISPEVKLVNYEGLKFEREKALAEESRVDEVLKNMINSRSKLQPISEDRPIQDGDFVKIDYEGTMDGTPVEHGKAENQVIKIGSKSYMPGFEEGLVGLKAGDQKTLHLKFPTPYHVKDYEGKDVQFNVAVREICKEVLPELDEEFFKSFGGPTDLESLKDSIRKDLAKSQAKRIEDAFRNEVLKVLVKNNPVEVPPSLLQSQKQSLVDDFKKRMSDQGVTNEEFDNYVERWDKDFERTAASMIQAHFLVLAIADKHDLHCTREDYVLKLKGFSSQTGIELNRIVSHYENSEGLMDRVSYNVTEGKVIDFLISKGTIKEVEPQSLSEN